MPRSVCIVAYPGIQILDVTGPLEVFSTANRIAADLAREDGLVAGPASYAPEVAAASTDPVVASCGLALVPARTLARVRAPLDTLVVAGGEGTEQAYRDPRLIAAIARLAGRARRVTSVCSGSFLLARAGLLDGRRATTHWGACDLLARRHPEVQVERDPIWVRDGHVWTSAGVTSGMDLALALVEDDLGAELARRVAQQLVLFLRRPGGQSQFSARLTARDGDRDGLRAVQDWIVANPGADLSVPALAHRAAMSPRNFARVFTREVGLTPGRFVEAVRVEAARIALETGDDGVEAIALDCGFGTAETLRRAFLRTLGVAPSDYRRRFRSPLDERPPAATTGGSP